MLKMDRIEKKNDPRREIATSTEKFSLLNLPILRLNLFCQKKFNYKFFACKHAFIKVLLQVKTNRQTINK